MKNKKSFIGIAILNYNSAEALEVTLDSLSRMKTEVPFICYVLDNASEDCKKAHEIFSKVYCKSKEFGILGRKQCSYKADYFSVQSGRHRNLEKLENKFGKFYVTQSIRNIKENIKFS